MKKEKKYLSLRILFFRWLVLFSVLPLAVIAFLFSYEFKSAVQIEILERLQIYTKQVQELFSEYEVYSQSRIAAVSEDKTILYGMKIEDLIPLRENLKKRLSNDVTASYVFYNSSGEVLLRVSSKDKLVRGPAKISSSVQEALEKTNLHTHAYYYSLDGRTHLNLSVAKKMYDESLSWTGYLEKTILVDDDTLKIIKEKMGADIIFFGPSGEIYSTSLPGKGISKDQLSRDFLKGNNHYFNVEVEGKSFGFISTTVVWGNQKFLIAVGAARTSLTTSVNRFRYILFAAFILLFIGIVLFSLRFTNQVIQPISKLVVGMRQMSETGDSIQVEHFSRTEVGLLADNFNEMSQQIAEYQDDLEAKIVDLEKANTEVKTTQEQLIQSAKLAGLGQLVAGVAHELNNPIGFIYSNINHLREYTDSLVSLINKLGEENLNVEKIKNEYDFDFISKDLPKLISSCEEGAHRTKEIVVGLRNFSRASDKDDKKFSVIDCLNSSLELLKSATKKGYVKIEKDYAEFAPLIQGNPNQVSQVFMNVLSNAFQALGDQGLVRIVVSYDKPNSQIITKISDDGSGIDPENMNKIFDPFFTTKDVGKGTGLGLSISYGIIQSHGGDLKVTSKLGKGTTFEIFLPCLTETKV